MKHLKPFQTLTESNLVFDKNITYKITISEKRLPELMMNLAGLINCVKLDDQYSIKVHKIEKSTFGAISKTFYITCSVSRPGHKFGHEEVMVNGKKTYQEPIDGVRFEVTWH